MHVVSAVCIDFLINAHKMYKESKVFQLIFSCKDRSSQSTSTGVDPSHRYFGKQPAFAQACFLDLSKSDLLMKRLFDSKEIREPYRANHRATQLTLRLRN